MTSTKYITRLTLILAIASLVISYVHDPTAVKGQDKDAAARGGAIFKIPDGYMQVPLTDFRGAMMLDPKKPAGMFVTYPNDNETTDALSQRLLKFIGPMFIHVDKGKPEPTYNWITKTLPSHAGDGDGKAVANTFSGESEELQVAIYERTTGLRPFLYGYFAMRHKKPKGDDGKFLDERGEGVKAFEKLWGSFPK